MKPLFTLIWLFLIPFLSFSQDILSARIEFDFPADDKLEVMYYVTAGPADSSLKPGDLTATVSCPTSSAIQLSDLKIISRERDNRYCSSDANVWVYAFKKSIDLNNAVYTDIAACCEVTLDLSLKNRNSLIDVLTTGSEPIYVYTKLSKCGVLSNKHSGKTTASPTLLNIQNYGSFAPLGMTDPAEKDSFSYELTTPLTSASSNVNYKTNFQFDKPFLPYYPGSLKHPYSNPNGSPPIGVHFNQSTGELVYTPIDTNVSAVAVLVKEWRKDASGKPTQIAVYHQEFGSKTIQAPSNNPPVIKSTTFAEVCAGDQVCFTATTDDKVKVPPPPLPVPDPDSVRIWWSNTIPGATFTVLDKKARLQSAQFCWIPKNSDASDVYHALKITAQDNHCPTHAITTKIVNVRVFPTPEPVSNVKQVSSNAFIIETSDTSGKAKNVSFYREIRDLNNQVVLDNRIFFSSTETYTSTSQLDSLKFSTEGTYVIATTVTSSQGGCNVVILDTINASHSSIPQLQNVGVSIYPNPVKTVLGFSKSLNDVRVYDNIGRLQIQKDGVRSDIDVSDLPAGIYFVTGWFNGQEAQARFVKR
ncbi:MAG: T9SS type A sorting domain-containing protein [Bacteroidia bacterium]|nr:T9SS type A sorting domain-containing protein [Bacteroidia bacterium]